MLLVFVKKLYLLDKIIKSKIIAFFKYIRCVMLANRIPANLRNSKPWTIYQNSLDFTKFPLTKLSNLVYVIFKNIRMQKMAC